MPEKCKLPGGRASCPLSEEAGGTPTLPGAALSALFADPPVIERSKGSARRKAVFGVWLPYSIGGRPGWEKSRAGGMPGGRRETM